MNKFFDKLPDTFIIFDTEFTFGGRFSRKKWMGKMNSVSYANSAIRVKKR